MSTTDPQHPEAAVRADISDWLALVSLPGLGPALMQRLLAAFGSPKAVLTAGRAAAHVEGIGPKLAALLGSQTVLSQACSWAAKEQKKAAAAGVRLISFLDPFYPPQLRTIHDPPALLWCRGDISFLQTPSVAVVGARSASGYGRNVSFMLARQLVQAGFTVVSGMAEGIDGQAHAGALAAGGSTVAVLGCGADVVYPRFHSRLYGQILAQGLIVSEYPLGAPPEPFRFPARNRIISGLSLGVIVVEAAVRSGAKITAELALEQNREVFAVPGRIDSPQSEGAHRLIQQGAHLVHSIEDILSGLPDIGGRGRPSAAPLLPDDLSTEERGVLTLFADCPGPADIDELTAKSGLPVSGLHGLLLSLELKGLLRQLPGQQYERTA
ncbi:DNA-processing protein DprA [Candidatus Electronema sp. TJ]|uniref:DNA-processing protein DprA n=1 Tax=Candidatus Electronema sp. TJ TaxID=3401573 RepID=UPI003AA9941D